MPFPEIGDELRIRDDDDNFELDVEVVEYIATGKVFRVKDTATKDDMFVMFTAQGRVYRCVDIDINGDKKEPWQA